MKAKYHGAPFHDYQSRKWLVTFECDKPPEGYDDLKDELLNIDIKKHRNRRSLNANAYFYVLVNKIAEALNITDTEVHDKMLEDNLCYIHDESGAIDWTVKDWIPNKHRIVRAGDDYWYDSQMEVVLAKPDGNYYTAAGIPKTSKIFWHIKGSHQMDTKEMSRLIDGTVQEAKTLGIETLTPDEIERMKQTWKV